MPKAELIGGRVDFHYEGQHITHSEINEWLQVWEAKRNKIQTPEHQLAEAMSNAEFSRTNKYAA